MSDKEKPKTQDIKKVSKKKTAAAPSRPALPRNYMPCKTFVARKDENPQWFLVDAKGLVLGRLASEITKILRGKHKPSFTPNVDTGDGVIIINSEKIVLTGSKIKQKIYRHYTGFQGGLKEILCEDLLKKKPEEVLRKAISRMMPKTKLARAQLKKLRLFVGEENSMSAQKPIVLKMKEEK